jgi:thiamine-phosphate pyrophosphorylase
MTLGLHREQLARAARALNARVAYARGLPALILMTDEKRLPNPLQAALQLPAATAIILRHTNADIRASLARSLAQIARQRGLILLIAGDAALAAKIRAHGLHLPEVRAREAAHWRALHPSWLITVAAHSARGLLSAGLFRADAALLAPAFATLSHKERPPLGVPRFRLMAARAAVPIYALGGVNAATIGRFKDAPLAGVAAIEGLVGDQSS